MIETERLVLRELTPDDFEALFDILSDPETMRHYPAPFDAEKVKGWIGRNLNNYARYGFGLWAVELKETGELIGECGVTFQNIDGETLPEIGYHIHRKCWRRGFAKEAAQAARDWFFQNTPHDAVYSYMKYTNVASCATAAANGMRKIKEYSDPRNTTSCVYRITRSEWEKLKKVAPVAVRFYDAADDALLKFAVIISRMNGKWVFCRHKDRNTYEIPGGHREAGEAILDTAKRELYEETGAIKYTIAPICIYSVTAPDNFDGEETFGALFFAEIAEREGELHSEIERVDLLDALPETWTYPLIQPKLIEEAVRRGGIRVCSIHA